MTLVGVKPNAPVTVHRLDWQDPATLFHDYSAAPAKESFAVNLRQLPTA